ncbi:amidase [Psychromonas arctica]|uniref:amidase n=1 Tax=Psychromonas arctica TaxID=168275 RepID=UPI002FCFF5D2
MLKNNPTLEQQSLALASGKETAVSLTLKALDKAEEFKHLNAYVVLNKEISLAQAEASDARRAAGKLLSALDGIPIAIKDNYLTKDYPTTACSNARPLEPSGQDATIVANLREAGVIIFGKTNMDEWAFSPTNVNSNIGPVLNPHNTKHVTGGSSGGSAAAVASGIVAAALGSDTGGSIRMPAAACGIYGFKPSYGRASRHGVLPLSWSLDAPGPLASSLQDIEMLLPYFLGNDPKDVSTFASTDFKKEQSNNTLEIVYLTGDGLESSAEVEQAVKKSLSASSAHVKEAELSHVDNYYEAWEAIIFSEAASYHQPLLQANADGFSSSLRVKLEAGSRLTALEVLHAQKLRSRLINTLTNELGEWDIIATPTLPVTAPSQNEEEQEFAGKTVHAHKSMLWFCVLGNMTGFPCVTLPVGFSDDGLPIGIMLMGKPNEDEKLLAMAMQFEQSIKNT